MGVKLRGSIKEVAEANKVYGLELVQEGKTIRLKRVNVKNRFSIPEPTETMCEFESCRFTLYGIIQK